ncbi:unnamed protein product [Chrysodeixis includens]|uniref:DUF229 domain containing protein n=1 Tax=Chrysodeixis includens TaxID=689277 RepID=A0A9N8L1V9_CHRIL|nr:unnamed protein product [Chrysodeixis includens]
MYVQRKQYILWTLTLISGSFVCYYNFNSKFIPKNIVLSQTHHVPIIINGNSDYLLNTPGCKIPNYAKNYLYPKNVPNISPNTVCGRRAITVKSINDTITFRIDEYVMRRYYAKSYSCCYKFAMRSKLPGHENDMLDYTNCSNFKDGTTVKLYEEIVTVTCKANKGQIPKIVYEDAYIILKKKNIKTNATVPKWNVLMLGLDTMSRVRFYDTLPLTAQYFQKYIWLDYRAYHKVGYNTFPNLMAVLTGLSMPTIEKKCRTELYNCANYFIWNKFKDAGYTTCYGEDHLACPDTFSAYKGLKKKPTDHYMRTFFLTGEKNIKQVMCTKKQPSATHLLKYAHSFATTYKNDGFFGLFWVNSYTHNHRSNPSILDEELESFFQKLYSSQTLENTFVIFFSDHGTRFGNMRIPMEAYYDERLPMLFIWTPTNFRRQHTGKYYNSHLNQARLITPYDLHLTLAEILELSTNSTNVTKAQGCPKCSSLFEIKSPYRTCADANINADWCSCHNMSYVRGSSNSSQESLQQAMDFLKNKQKSIKTLPCSSCHEFKRPQLLRSHDYHYGNKSYNVVAFLTSPHRVAYEAIVVSIGNTSEVLSLRTITAYNTKGNCVINPNHRGYCVCEYHEKCRYRKKKKTGRV